MSKRELDDLFKSKLSGYETEVRPEAWDRLSAKMNRKKGIILWQYWSMGIAASLMLTMGVYFYPYTQEQKPVAAIEENSSEPVEIKKAEPTKTNEQPSGPEKIDTLSTEQESAAPPVRKKNLQAPAYKLHKSYIAEQLDSKQKTNKEQAPQTFPVKELETAMLTGVVAKQTAEPIHDHITVTLALAAVEEPTIPENSTDLKESNEKKKPLKQLWQQVKALRKGEPVSFKEIRQTSQQLIAVAFDKENQE